MSKQKIEVCNVSKKFGNSVVLNDVSLEFDSGEIRINSQVMHKDIDILKSADIIIEEPGYIRNFSGLKT